MFFPLLFITSFCFSQFVEDFSDGNFSENPKWLGNIENFIVNNDNQLQLNDADVSQTTSQLLVPVETTDSTNWFFYLKLGFSPSSSNFARIYLSSSTNDLKSPLNGYFLKIGGITGSDDAIELYKQTGSDNTLLISGVKGGAGGSEVEAWVKVTKNSSGKFELFVDYQGDGNYDSQGVYYDGNPYGGKFFGWVCKYTSTRKDKFFLDDIVIDPIYVDVFPPKLVRAFPISDTEVDVVFDEPIGDITPTIFDVSNLSIKDFFVDDSRPEIVHLILNESLENGQSYTLTVNKIQDTKGNSSNKQSINFEYVKVEKPRPLDVIITEIMADPSPSIGLPEAEYLEIYNRTDKNISLDGVTISSGTPRALGASFIPAHAYLILCDVEDVAAFSSYGNVVGVENFPSLSNSHDEVILADENGNWIDRVEYFSFMYGGKGGDGGISLERINLNDICDFILNWSASTSFDGGTPGKINAVNDENLDFAAFQLKEVFPESKTELSFTFNKNINQASFSDVSNFSFNPKLEIDSIRFSNAISNTFVMVLKTPLSETTTYQLDLNAGVTDCVGNPIASKSLTFGLPQKIEKGDIVINEILFNPATGGSDFVELYNNSEKILDLESIVLSNNLDPDTKQVVGFHQLFLPKDYIVLTKNVFDIETRYHADLYKMINMNLPTMDDKEGNITLSTIENGTTKIIDAFDYLDDYQSELIADLNGVSLERISPNAPTQDPNNWQSAAQSAGFATPTRANSQQLDLAANQNKFIQLPYNTISPDGDGFQDVLIIQYKVDKPGYVINANIYNEKGQLVKKIFKNYGIGIAGHLKWDGSDNDGNKSSVGVYILWIQFVLDNGTVKVEKIPFILAENFN